MKYLQQASLGNRSYFSYILTITILILIIIVVGQLAYSVGMSVVGITESQYNDYTLAQARDVMGKNLFLIVNLFPFVVQFVVILLAIRFVHKRPVLSIFTARSKFDWKRFILSFGLFGLVLGLGLTHTLITTDTTKWNFHPETFWMLMGLSFFVLPLQTAVEELVFRGYMLQGSINLFKKPIATIFISSFLFAILHFENPEVIKLGNVLILYYFASGLFMSLLTVLDDGLELSMGFHTVNNIFGTLILTNNWQVFQTDALFIDNSVPDIGWDLWIIVLLIYPGMLFVFHKIYKWRTWSDVLFETIELENLDQMEDHNGISKN